MNRSTKIKYIIVPLGVHWDYPQGDKFCTQNLILTV